MTTISRFARVAATVGIAAIGFMGFAGTASAAEEAPLFNVCSPLGCDLQSVKGDVVGLNLLVTATDKAPNASLTARLFTNTGQSWTIFADDNVSGQIMVPLSGQASSLTVSACASTGGCNTQTIPLP